MMKGVVIMTSINLQNQRSLSYSEVFFNEKEIKTITSYHTILQNKITAVFELILTGYNKLITFSKSYLNQNKIIDSSSEEAAIFNDIAIEYSDILKNGIPLLSSLSYHLEEKQVDKKTLEFLKKIINYQMETTKELLMKELTLERVDVIYNHLKDVPYYLKTDLELSSLPNLKPAVDRKPKKSEYNGWKVVKQKYNPNHKDYIA
ncbi:hypothetical protein [Oceanobacillus locisalsi]|uniref:Uncharacterized protein n=1 Tax=Oceanobacillus locisalsi TaxID=546107 RepID=A0ABW3NLJ7_9BACI